MVKINFSKIKEIKTINSNYFKYDAKNDKLISKDEYINSLLNKGWIILDIYDGNFVLGLPKSTEKSSSQVSIVK